MELALQAQRTMDYDATPTKPSTKRKPSARAAFRMDEIPKVAEAMTETYSLRDQLLFRCNTVWGLRAHEQLGMTIGDICYSDGTLKDAFVIASTHGQNLLYLRGELSQLTCTAPRAVICHGP